MNKTLKNGAVILLVAGVLPLASACQTTDARVAGNVGGAIAGGLVGSMFGSGAGKLVAVGVGTLVGAYIGGEIAAALAPEDQQRHQAAMQQAVASGQTITWNNPKSGNSGTIQVKKTEKREDDTKIAVLKDRVKSLPPLEMIGEDYKAKAKTPVRGGPGADYAPVDTLSKGQTVQVIGKVKGKDWYMVAQDGAGSGFVPAGQLQATGVAAKPATPSQVQTAAVETASVKAERTCRTVEQDVALANGSIKKETTTACLGPNGWQVES